MMPGEVVPVLSDHLVQETLKLKLAGYRFVTLTCLAAGEEAFEVLYHFDRDLTLQHLRLTQPRETPVPSISKVFFCAFLAENEAQDQFGIRFDDLVLDYGRTLYLEKGIETPPFSQGRPGRPEGEAGKGEETP